MPDYIPQGDPQLSLWCDNMRLKITANLAALGLVAAEGTAITDACDDIIDSISAVETSKATTKSLVATKENTKKSQLGIIRNYVKRGKTAAGYTSTIGADLQIIGEEPADDPSAFKTVLKADLFPGYVRISFTKKMVDGVNIYARLKGQPAWQFLARDTVSPYHDTRPLATPPQAETREYMAIGVLDDAEVGLASDIVEAVFGG